MRNMQILLYLLQCIFEFYYHDIITRRIWGIQKGPKTQSLKWLNAEQPVLR